MDRSASRWRWPTSWWWSSRPGFVFSQFRRWRSSYSSCR
ncbi:hypothetical protein MMMB2_3161 [Mycobacterium marinum MB2]|nr:hypothetical protein MMMB2_3161 [Mycobacterium marinum MB2]